MDVTLVTSIPNEIHQDDDVVILHRIGVHGAVADPNETFDEAIERAVSGSKTGMIVLATIKSVEGRLNERRNWIDSDVRAERSSVIWESPGKRGLAQINFHDPTSGEIKLGNATVRTEHVVFEPGKSYLIFLRTDDDERMSPSRYPLLVDHEKVYNNWDRTHSSSTHKDPLHDHPLRKVVDALRFAAKR